MPLAEDFPDFATLIQNMSFHIQSDLDECVTPIGCCAVREGENGSGSTVNTESIASWFHVGGTTDGDHLGRRFLMRGEVSAHRSHMVCAVTSKWK